jgi:hypothetical protein
VDHLRQHERVTVEDRTVEDAAWAFPWATGRREWSISSRRGRDAGAFDAGLILTPRGRIA